MNPHNHRSLPEAARRAIWDRLWERLLQPLPSEAVPADNQGPAPDEAADRRRDKAVPR